LTHKHISTAYDAYIVCNFVLFLMYIFILQSFPADSVRETRHRMESSQHSTRCFVITHIT